MKAARRLQMLRAHLCTHTAASNDTHTHDVVSKVVVQFNTDPSAAWRTFCSLNSWESREAVIEDLMVEATEAGDNGNE